MSRYDPKQALRLLFIGRHKNKRGFFGEDYFPLDLFKLIYFDVKEYNRYIVDLACFDFEWIYDKGEGEMKTVKGISLRDCPFAIRNDKECCLVAFAQYGRALKFASEDIQNDNECCKVGFAEDGLTLKFGSKEIQNDKECCKVAFAQDGWAFFCASKEIQNDKECCKVAFAQEGWTLKFASKEIQNDKECCVIAVMNNERAILFVSEEIRSKVEELVKIKKQELNKK